MEHKTLDFPKSNIYKSKLQELCQSKKWALPRYSSMKDGVDHNPPFKSSVIVNGLSFNTLSPCNPSKKPTMKLPCLPSFTVTSSGSEPTCRKPKTTETHKNPDSEQQYSKKLQIYAERKNLGVPSYGVQSEGLSHDLCFKATVSVGGESFQGPGLYKSTKEAEDAAAQYALMSLISAAFQESNTRPYKSLLQEVAQSRGDFMPAYRTSMSGEPHNPSFVSTVEFKGEVFHGTAANSKKQAQDNAAKIAYTALMIDEKPHQTCGNSPGSLGYKNNTLELGTVLNAFTIGEKKENEMQAEQIKGEEEEVFQNNGVAEGMKTYLLCNRFGVYTHIPKVVFPKGTVVIPIREGEWVIANLEFPNEK